MSFLAGPYTVTLGGSALLAGVRGKMTLAVPGARVGMQVLVTPQTDPGDGVLMGGYVSANDVVTIWIQPIIALTPVSVVYNVTVLQ